MAHKLIVHLVDGTKVHLHNLDTEQAVDQKMDQIRDMCTAHSDDWLHIDDVQFPVSSIAMLRKVQD